MDPTRRSVLPFPASGRCTRSELEILTEIGERRVFDPGEVVLEDGARSERFFVVLEGRLKMIRFTPAGKDLILALLGPGEVIGISAALGEETTCTMVEAMMPSVCLGVRREDLYALFTRRPDAMATVMPLLTRQLRECNNCIVESSCSRVETRFAVLFLRFVDSMGERRSGAWFVPLPLSRQELADLGGTTIETAIRIMSRWGKEGVVETLDDGFLVRQRGTLEELV